MAIGGSVRVLVVEDDEGMREAIESLLDAAGMRSTAYASAEALLGGGALDDGGCLITDLELPTMSGLALLAKLRESHAHIQVIVITAHGSRRTRSEAARLGAAAYLSKPFEADALLKAIQRVTRSAKSP